VGQIRPPLSPAGHGVRVSAQALPFGVHWTGLAYWRLPVARCQLREGGGLARATRNAQLATRNLPALRFSGKTNIMRLVTRGDLDGLTSAAIISLKEPIDAILLVHPQEITDRKVEVRSTDILANVPWDPRCGKWFDHHLLTASNQSPPKYFEGKHGLTLSAARLVYEYYTERHPDDPALLRLSKLVDETDRLDGARLTPDDVERPRGYILLGYTIDSRTGLGSFDDFFRKLVDAVKTMPIEEVLQLPEVKERVERIFNEQEQFRKLLERNSFRINNVVVTDLREIEHLP